MCEAGPNNGISSQLCHLQSDPIPGSQSTEVGELRVLPVPNFHGASHHPHDPSLNHPPPELEVDLGKTYSHLFTVCDYSPHTPPPKSLQDPRDSCALSPFSER